MTLVVGVAEGALATKWRCAARTTTQAKPTELGLGLATPLAATGSQLKLSKETLRSHK